MGLRTVAEFKASVRDGRVIYYGGERVHDVTEHPYLRIGVETAAVDYQITEDPQVRAACVVQREDGELYNRFFQEPRSTEDLLQRRTQIEVGARHCFGWPPFAKEGGGDGLNGVHVASAHVDKALGTEYHQRIKAFRRRLQDQDLSLAIAMTDVKGNRSLRPSAQADPDLYLRIVRRTSEGIVVRGAKAHITSAPHTNEIIVLPTRAMTEADADYAVSFAVRPDTPGITMIARPGAAMDPFDYPVSARYDMWEALVIFDDVFVPWERVFLNGEWQWAGLYTEMFANFHRFTASCYKYASGELLVGAGQAIAEYNGTARAAHVRDKIAQLVSYAETIRALTLAAAHQPVLDEVTGLVYPDRMISNIAKMYFAENFHAAIKAVQDIGGGILVTAPAAADWQNSETGPLVKKYLAGNAKYTTEERLRMIKFIRDFTASETGGLWQVTTIHAEGSLAAEKMTIYREANLERYVDVARRAAGIDGKHS